MGVPARRGHWWKHVSDRGAVWESYATEGSDHERELVELGWTCVGNARTWAGVRNELV